MGICNSKCKNSHLKRIDESWFPSEDMVDGRARTTACQLLCHTCLYCCIKYGIQNSDFILKALYPDIYDWVER
ncbi:U exon [Psittacine adenovirus 2]|uniref:U exon n=1 Tax=Psittacine adenovirus 2 TaxID=1301246 RepID=A0ABX8SNB1_9ADEN|nr:U exon protein [Psittacine adenovirus 2]QZW33259.1 ORF20 U exon [Psittacine siadenovirus F]QXX30966.1 U exon [Psittacine adenovirus 2]QZW33704.1 ORF20 U exon [Psittacine adenovirus 2]WGL41028.1 U exon [Psittacine siadenovirus F]